jgi:hypothetical protein
MESVRLSRRTTVVRYRAMEAAKDRKGIAQFLRERFNERYFRPVESMAAPHGFLITAVSCLLIESIHAFRNGWQGITEQRKKPYRRFFRDHVTFGVTPEQADELYDNIRSGIFHLGETYGGWRIHRRGPLLDFQHRTLNANLFFEKVQDCFEGYCQLLERSGWESEVWTKFRGRMNDLIRNCEIRVDGHD